MTNDAVFTSFLVSNNLLFIEGKSSLIGEKVMRKKIIGFLIIPILLIAVVGCDLDSLSEFMGNMGKNAYLEAGFVPLDKTQTNNIKNKFEDLFKNNKTDTDLVRELIPDLKEIMSSSGSGGKTEELKNQLSGKAEVPEELGQTIEEINGSLEDLGKELDVDLKIEVETEADLLVVALIETVIDDYKELFDDIGKEGEERELSDDEIDELIGDAIPDLLFVMKVAEGIGSESVADLANFFGDMLDEAMSKNQ